MESNGTDHKYDTKRARLPLPVYGSRLSPRRGYLTNFMYFDSAIFHFNLRVMRSRKRERHGFSCNISRGRACKLQ